jgi:peptidoglycan pentaglycine glycine transferase (the first glycine)
MIPFTGTPQAWDELIASLPIAHLLQTWEWSQVKAKYGWQPMPFIWFDQPCEGSEPSQGSPVAAAMILKRSIPVGGFSKRMCVLYVPKGPLMDWNNAALRQLVMGDLEELARHQGAIFIKMDPDVALGTGIPGTADAVEFSSGQKIRSEMLERGWKFSQDQIQFRNTVLIDLSPSEDEQLALMKQKTRYNIRLAQKKGVTVRVGTVSDGPLMYQMYARTSLRDHFLIREEGYYQTVWRIFMDTLPSSGCLQPFSEPLIAEVDGQAVGAVSLFYFAGQAIYLFGMSITCSNGKQCGGPKLWAVKFIISGEHQTSSMRAIIYGACFVSRRVWGEPYFVPSGLGISHLTPYCTRCTQEFCPA